MKAAAIYSHMALDHEKRDFICSTKSIDIMVALISHQVEPIKREIITSLLNIIK
jgi:hypothetical protein